MRAPGRRPVGLLSSALAYSLLVVFVWVSSSPSETVPAPASTAAHLPTPSPVQSTAPSATATDVVSTRKPVDPAVTPTNNQLSSSPTDTPTSAPAAVPSPTSLARATRVSEVLGTSSQGRPLFSYQFGDGPDHLVFIGGIHGGYEWNTILLAYRAIDYFTLHPQLVPASVTLHIIPSANPDGQFQVTSKTGRFDPVDVDFDNFPGRFNGNKVDLNRNWDCNWMEVAFWRDRVIDPGERPFSEPENVALRDFLLERRPVAVVFWHSAANGVYAAGCPDLYQPSYELAKIYGRAARYPVYEAFDAYQVTGDAGDWLALQEIPSVSVEMSNHQDIEWPKNLVGMLAVLNQYRQLQNSRDP